MEGPSLNQSVHLLFLVFWNEKVYLISFLPFKCILLFLKAPPITNNFFSDRGLICDGPRDFVSIGLFRLYFVY